MERSGNRRSILLLSHPVQADCLCIHYFPTLRKTSRCRGEIENSSAVISPLLIEQPEQIICKHGGRTHLYARQERMLGSGKQLADGIGSRYDERREFHRKKIGVAGAHVVNAVTRRINSAEIRRLIGDSRSFPVTLFALPDKLHNSCSSCNEH